MCVTEVQREAGNESRHGVSLGNSMVDRVHLGHVGTRPVVCVSAAFWENRYATGGTSGAGSEGANADWKATVINDFVSANTVADIVEYGCGDGRQLELADYPDYTGFDVSETAIRMCKQRFQHDPKKQFYVLPTPWPVSANLVLSLDVIYHLVEDKVFEQHMRDVFGSALQWVILYTTDSDSIDPDFKPASHVRHRPVTSHVQTVFPDWEILGVLLNPAPHMGGCDFYMYGRP